MRRTKFLAAIAAPILAATMLAACSSSGSGGTGGGSTGANANVTVTGAYGKTPSVKIPSKTAGTALTVKTLHQGSGTTVSSSGAFVANYVLYLWDGSSHKLVENTFTSAPQLLDGTLLPGLTTALDGKPVGSRVLAIVPPADGYGSTGNSQEGITANDTMVFVVDLLGTFSNNESVAGTQTQAGAGLPTVTPANGAAPTITIPSSAPPSKLTVKPLITGTGPAVAAGQMVVVQYTAVIWRTGKVFSSTWSGSAPTGFQVGVETGGPIAGLNIGLVGQRVGSRVLLTIPPDEGYGPKGESSVGITGTDTLVFVVDILGVFG
jgi:FKBP-type peptidyl-prolyl cis-trans isomerase